MLSALGFAWVAMQPPPALDREGMRRVDETRRAAANLRGRLPAVADVYGAMGGSDRVGIAMALSEADIEAVAARVADLLRPGPATVELVDAAEIARRFGVSRDFVYGHANDFGVVRLGEGPKARLRFDPAKVRELLGAADQPAPGKRPPRRKRRSSNLLPVRGRGRS